MNFKKAVSFFVVVSVVMCFSNPGLLGDVATFNVVTGNLVKIAQQWKDVESLAMGQKIHDTKSRATYEATLKAVKEKVPVLEAWKVKYPVYEAWYKILAPFETTLTGAIAHVKSLESAPAASSSSSTGVAQKSSYSAVFLSQLVHGAKAAQGYTEDQILEQTSHRSTYDKLRAQLQKVVPDLKSAGWENGNAYNKKTYEMLEAFLKKLVGAFSAAGAVKTSNYSAAFLSQLVNTANNSAKYEVLQIQASTSSHAAYNKIHAQLQKVVPDLIAAGWETGNEYNKKTYVPLKKFLDQLDLVFPKNKKDLGLTVQPSSTQPPPPPPKQPEQKAKSLADQISDFEVLFQGKYSEDDVVKFGMFASDNKNEINADDDLANRVAALMKIVLGGDGGSRDVGSETSLSDWLTKFEAKFEGEFSDSDVTEFDEFIEKNLSALSESDDFLARVEALSQKLGGDGLVGEPLATVNFGSGVTSAEFSPDGKYVIAVGAGEGASGSSHRVYSVVPGTDSQGPALREIGTGYNHGKALRDATWSSDGQHVVVCGSASNNATSRVYSVIDGVLSQTDVGYYSASETFSVAWNPVHRWVAICHGDTRYGIYYFKDNYKLQVAYAKAGGDGAWRCVAWSPGGEYLAIAGSVRGGKTHKICRFDVKQNGRLGEKTEISSVNHGAELESVAWSPDGKFLAVAGISDSGGVTHRIYKVTDGVMEEVGSGYQHGSRLRSISWISNSMLVVGGENNEGISSRTYNVDENGILSEVEGAAYNAGEQVFATDCDPLGKYVICGGSNGELSIRGIHIPALFKSIFDEAIADLSLSDAEIVQNKTAIEQRVAAMQGRTEEIDFGKLPSWFQTKFSDTKNALHAKIASGFDGSLQPFDFNSISSGSEFFFKTERGFVAAVDETPKVFLDPKLIINQGSGAVKLVLYSGAAWWQTDKFLEKTSDGKLKFTGSANGIAFTPQKFGNFVVFKNSSGDDYMKFVSESEFVMGGTLIEAVKFELTTEDDLRLAAVKSILKDIKPTSLAGMKAAMASFLNAFELASNRKTAVDEIGNDLKTKVAEWMQAGWWWNPDVSGVYPAHYIKAFASEVKKLGASVGLVSEINQGYETGRITRMGSPLPDSQVLPTISTQVVTDGSGIDIVADTSGLAPAAGPAITFSFTSPGSVVIKIGQSYLEAVDGSLILQKDQNRFAPAAQVGITYETDTATGDVHVWLKSGGNYLAGKSDGYRSADAKLTFSEVSTAYSSKFKIVPVDLSTMAFKLMHVESGGYALLLPKLRGLYIRKDNGWGAFKALVEEAEATVFEASPRLIPEGVSVGETLQAYKDGIALDDNPAAVFAEWKDYVTANKGKIASDEDARSKMETWFNESKYSVSEPKYEKMWNLIQSVEVSEESPAAEIPVVVKLTDFDFTSIENGTEVAFAVKHGPETKYLVAKDGVPTFVNSLSKVFAEGVKHIKFSYQDDILWLSDGGNYLQDVAGAFAFSSSGEYVPLGILSADDKVVLKKDEAFMAITRNLIGFVLTAEAASKFDLKKIAELRTTFEGQKSGLFLEAAEEILAQVDKKLTSYLPPGVARDVESIAGLYVSAMERAKGSEEAENKVISHLSTSVTSMKEKLWWVDDTHNFPFAKAIKSFIDRKIEDIRLTAVKTLVNYVSFAELLEPQSTSGVPPEPTLGTFTLTLLAPETGASGTDVVFSVEHGPEIKYLVSKDGIPKFVNSTSKIFADGVESINFIYRGNDVWLSSGEYYLRDVSGDLKFASSGDYVTMTAHSFGERIVLKRGEEFLTLQGDGINFAPALEDLSKFKYEKLEDLRTSFKSQQSGQFAAVVAAILSQVDGRLQKSLPPGAARDLAAIMDLYTSAMEKARGNAAAETSAITHLHDAIKKMQGEAWWNDDVHNAVVVAAIKKFIDSGIADSKFSAVKNLVGYDTLAALLAIPATNSIVILKISDGKFFVSSDVDELVSSATSKFNPEAHIKITKAGDTIGLSRGDLGLTIEAGKFVFKVGAPTMFKVEALSDGKFKLKQDEKYILVGNATALGAVGTEFEFVATTEQDRMLDAVEGLEALQNIAGLKSALALYEALFLKAPKDQSVWIFGELEKFAKKHKDSEYFPQDRLKGLIAKVTLLLTGPQTTTLEGYAGIVKPVEATPEQAAYKTKVDEFEALTVPGEGLGQRELAADVSTFINALEWFTLDANKLTGLPGDVARLNAIINATHSDVINAASDESGDVLNQYIEFKGKVPAADLVVDTEVTVNATARQVQPVPQEDQGFGAPPGGGGGGLDSFANAFG